MAGGLGGARDRAHLDRRRALPGARPRHRGEVSYSLVAGAGLGIAAALGWVQTRPKPRSGTVAAIAVVAAIALSALLTVAVYYLGASLAGS